MTEDILLGLTIRSARTADGAAIRAVHLAAFQTDAEARLVDLLLERGDAAVSLVAERDGGIVGHAVFSTVTIDGHYTKPPGAALGPIAVMPEQQRRGIGGRLIESGVQACNAAGFGYIVVLGDPAYYPRFGFSRASSAGLSNEYGVDEPFMAMSLTGGSLPRGLVRYCDAFREVDV